MRDIIRILLHFVQNITHDLPSLILSNVGELGPQEVAIEVELHLGVLEEGRAGCSAAYSSGHLAEPSGCSYWGQIGLSDSGKSERMPQNTSDTSTICFKTVGLSKQDSYKMRKISHYLPFLFDNAMQNIVHLPEIGVPIVSEANDDHAVLLQKEGLVYLPAIV